jgi:hypothetical protein
VRTAVRVALGLLATTTATSAVAEVLVLRSVGPSSSRYPAGQRLPDNASFTLRANDMVTLLTPQGTRVFRGQGVFVANRTYSGGRQSAAQVRIDIGGTRGPDAEAGAAPSMPDSVWSFAAYAQGNLCFPAGARPMLWRSNPREAINMVVADAGGREHSVAWPAGETVVAWPASLAVTPNAPYRLRMPGAQPQRIWLRPIVNGNALDRDSLAQALIAARCQEQVATFAALNLAPAEEPGAP